MPNTLDTPRNKPEFKLGQIVYHRKVYEHKEPLEVVGIMKDKLLLEGDYSGGTCGATQRDWLPIKGVSRIQNYTYKAEARKMATDITALAIPAADSKDNTFVAMMDMVNAVLRLTNDVCMNPEY
jgi:hypothetical protein